MKKLLLALIALQALASVPVKARDSFWGGFAGGATGSYLGTATAPRRTKVVYQGGGYSRAMERRIEDLEDEVSDLRKELRRIHKKLDKMNR